VRADGRRGGDGGGDEDEDEGGEATLAKGTRSSSQSRGRSG